MYVPPWWQFVHPRPAASFQSPALSTTRWQLFVQKPVVVLYALTCDDTFAVPLMCDDVAPPVWQSEQPPDTHDVLL